MRAEKVIAALLNAAAPVTAIVGSRIYGNVAQEQAPAPLIVYRKLGAQRVDAVSMPSEAVVESRVEVLIVASTYEQLKDLAEKVRIALSYKRGAIAGVDCINVDIADEGPDDYDPDLREHGQTWAYLVRHTE